jgi:CheY-like chemotaxis protein
VNDSAKKPSVLLVDDNRDQLAMTAMLLKLEGIDVRTAPDGPEALRLLSLESADCVVTDLYMPQMDGVELIAEVRTRYPDTKVIAVSGKTFEGRDYLHVATRVGAHAVLRKPVDPLALLDAIAAPA